MEPHLDVVEHDFEVAMVTPVKSWDTCSLFPAAIDPRRASPGPVPAPSSPSRSGRTTCPPQQGARRGVEL